MEIIDRNKILDNLEEDLALLIKDKFHPKHEDLINMVFGEDIPELINFARKVNHAFEGDFVTGTGKDYEGAKLCYDTLKRFLYGT